MAVNGEMSPKEKTRRVEGSRCRYNKLRRIRGNSAVAIEEKGQVAPERHRRCGYFSRRLCHASCYELRSLLNRAVRRALPRDAVFLGTTPLRTARSNRLIACGKAASAVSRSPAPMARTALVTPTLRVAVRTPLFRWARFTCCRATFLAGNYVLLFLCPAHTTGSRLLRRHFLCETPATPMISHTA